MKVADLSGAELDYWVMRALSGDPARVIRGRPRPYSSDWSDGGPIIEREWIHLQPVYTMDGRFLYWTAKSREWVLGMDGDTPLIAAMRAYVASKFGDEVPGEK